ncbi:DEAD/DEAH box helicase family protein, partial [Acinetobacter baumannii]
GDVLKTEKRLIEENKKGILFTNGTGTGKTFTGLGVAKRFINAGLKNILIVTLNDKIANDFVKSSSPLNIKAYKLKSIKENGGEDHS